MAARSFSLLLARRYLNPRRSSLSIFSLISLIGVTLGVMVLVVVMAVYAGLERSTKERLLGFTPHVLMHLKAGPGESTRVDDWRTASEPLKGMPGVESTTPFIADNLILDIDSNQRPAAYCGIDTEDKVQVENIERLLDKTHYPSSTADMGLDDRIVVSSIIADQFQLHIGDKVRLYSTRNFEKVMQAYKTTEKPPVRQAFAEKWTRAKELLGSWKQRGSEETLKTPALADGYNLLVDIIRQNIRGPEAEMIQKILDALDAGTGDEAAQVHSFSAEQRRAVEEAIAGLDHTDAEKMDAEALKNLKQIVLPKEAEVIGVYQVSQMAVMPDMFMPLSLAQTLSGLDDSVQGIAVRLKDPYQAANLADGLQARMGPQWESLTWMEKNETFFQLISQQRMMMYVALSVIMLVAAFSMTAVMFTVTIQKRREIGVMKALGATSWQIVRVFLYQGMILGCFGAVLGVGAGRVFVHFRGSVQQLMRVFGFDPFAAKFIGFNVLPAHNDPVEQMSFALAAFLLCSVAALVPAFFAARADAAKSLRNL